ncbi:MAG: aldo/keto reductase [Candidatus Eremiobacteraeota bacterium]|nr:aldo/keto reductase [Candidatus Eremiobacteraeota bacterium]
MVTKPFAATGIELPPIGQGSWDIPEHGGRMTEAKTAIRRGIELGLVHIDTAEMYGNGAAEKIIGQAIAEVPREQLFLTSKVLPSHAAYDDVLKACDRSLKRLKTEYLDLYLLHWPSSVPLEETMRALEALVERGKARCIGVSNFDLAELREAQAHLHKERVACNQVLYHLRERGIEVELLPYCVEHEIAIVGYTPFGRGKFPRDGIAPDGVLGKIATSRSKTPRQVILNFLTREPALFAIPKASIPAHVEENAGAMGWALDPSEISAIDRAYPVRYNGTLETL